MTRPPPSSPLFPPPPLSRPPAAGPASPGGARRPVGRGDDAREDAGPARSRAGQPAPRARRRLLARRSEEHTSELQSRPHLVCRLLLEKKKKKQFTVPTRC